MGELLLIGGDGTASKAVQCFREEIERARLQSAKTWELRTTISLARLLDQQQRRDEARMMLATVIKMVALLARHDETSSPSFRV